jgi:hypothetical protein
MIPMSDNHKNVIKMNERGKRQKGINVDFAERIFY